MVYAYLLFGAIFSGMVILIILFMKDSKGSEQDKLAEERLKTFISSTKKQNNGLVLGKEMIKLLCDLFSVLIDFIIQ